MRMRKSYKTLIITLSILAASLLPGVVTAWAEVDSNLTETGLNTELLIPSAQGNEAIARPPSFFGDMIVQFGEEGEEISAQSDNSGVEVVPSAAFIHTNELGNGTEAQDWFFSFAEGYLTNDSGGNLICLAAPVYLPPGNIITSFKGYVRDNSTAADIAIFLDRTASLGGWTELAAVQSTGSSTSIQGLTDPSIFSGGGANVIAPGFNYHVSLCLPANSDFSILVYGAQVTYSSNSGLSKTYLPLVLKPDPTLVQSRVFLTNQSGGTANYTILNTPQGNISCSVPNGAANFFCNKAFTSGTYNWTAQLVCGTIGPKQKEFPPGNVYPTAFRCD
jgi:hypothetical protein